ncbi:MAG TPA: hypothetical protein VJN88_11525 [Ktedonobacterales bacterium]|nr:hypothetical protein [Ktedonobacterales bacterium]
MLTDRLRAVVDSAADFSPDAQDKLAAQIEAWLDALDDALWDQQFADPRSQAIFAEMAAQAEKGPFLPFPTPEDMGDQEAEPGTKRAERRP